MIDISIGQGFFMSIKHGLIFCTSIVVYIPIQEVLLGVVLVNYDETETPKGAAYVFGPQKSADSYMVEELDKGLVNLCEVIKKDIGIDLKDVPGGGAAGAMGAGMIAFFNSKLQMGIETL